MRVAEAASAALARIEAREPLLRAWAYLDPPRIVAAARALDDTVPGALHGLMVGVKDAILTADMPTGYNTDLPDRAGPAVDAACVAMLRAAGALIFGKTQTVEFGAIGRAAPTRNPHDPSRTPGGSSSGSAAAVADGHVPVALGTQTGGSIIRPASFCGVYGFKPSWGVVSGEGAKRFAPSLDTVGWFARDLADLARLLAVLAPSLPTAPAVGRIAVWRTPMWGQAGPATQAAMAHAARVFTAAGARVTELAMPAMFDRLHEAHGTIMRAEGGRIFLPEVRRYGDALHPNLLGMVRDLERLDPDRLRAAYDLAGTCRAVFDELAAGYDAVLVPSAPGEAPDAALGTGDYVFNGLWTLLHTPCLNLPLWCTEAGLPVGVTLTGPRFADWRVIQAAREIEAARATAPSA